MKGNLKTEQNVVLESNFNIFVNTLESGTMMFKMVKENNIAPTRVNTMVNGRMAKEKVKEFRFWRLG